MGLSALHDAFCILLLSQYSILSNLEEMDLWEAMLFIWTRSWSDDVLFSSNYLIPIWEVAQLLLQCSEQKRKKNLLVKFSSCCPSPSFHLSWQADKKHFQSWNLNKTQQRENTVIRSWVYGNRRGYSGECTTHALLFQNVFSLFISTIQLYFLKPCENLPTRESIVEILWKSTNQEWKMSFCLL